jgi:small GTP-binding protein
MEPIGVAKVLVVGAAGVGKTSLIHRWLHNAFIAGPYRASTAVEPSLLSVVSPTSPDVTQIHFWDVPAAETTTGRTPILYANAMCVVIVVDASNAESFDEAKRWKKDVDQRVKLPCALVVNKVDKVQPQSSALDAFARQNGFRTWLVTSAATASGPGILPEVVQFVVRSLTTTTPQ